MEHSRSLPLSRTADEKKHSEIIERIKHRKHEGTGREASALKARGATRQQAVSFMDKNRVHKRKNTATHNRTQSFESLDGIPPMLYLLLSLILLSRVMACSMIEHAYSSLHAAAALSSEVCPGRDICM